MTPADIEQTARAFEKVKSRPPTDLADWARANVPELITLLQRAYGPNAFVFDGDPLAALRDLYPGSSEQGFKIDDLAAADVKALRARRSADAGYVPGPEEAVEDAIAVAGYPLAIEALRPFAALGAPATIEAITRVAASVGVDWPETQPLILVRDEHGEDVVAISRDQAKRAFDLIQTHDGK